MNNRGKKKRKRKHEFAFSGFMKCGKCGCLITAETQRDTSIIVAPRKSKPVMKSISAEALVEQMKSVIQKFLFPTIGVTICWPS